LVVIVTLAAPLARVDLLAGGFGQVRCSAA